MSVWLISGTLVPLPPSGLAAGRIVTRCGMTHVGIPPYGPQRNGEIESWRKAVNRECMRPLTPLNLKDARRTVATLVREYNAVRLLVASATSRL